MYRRSLALLALAACSSPYAGLERAPLGTATRDSAPVQASAPQMPAGTASYWFGLIRRGPNWSPEPTEATAELQRAHLANIGRLVGERKLVLAGPFDNGHGDLRGLFIYDVETREEAEALVQSDPAVQAGRLVVELLPWWGTDRLRGLLDE